MVSAWWADTKDGLPANTKDVFYSSVVNLAMLESLNLDGCELLTKLPDGIINISNLKYVKNDCLCKVQKLIHGFGQWSKLLTRSLMIECWSNKKDLTEDCRRVNLRTMPHSPGSILKFIT
jgi:hypothetical protein